MAYVFAKQNIFANGSLSLKVAYSGLSLAQGTGIEDEANLHNIIGIYYSLSGAYDSSASHYIQALAIAQRTTNLPLLYKVKGNMGDLYSYKGEYAKALEYQFDVLRYREERNEKDLVAMVLANIGNSYNKMGEETKALAYYEQALPMVRGKGNRLEGNLYNSIATIYNNATTAKKADSLLAKSLLIKMALKDSLGILTVLVNQATCAYYQKQYELARTTNMRAMKYAIALKNTKNIQTIQLNLAKLEDDFKPVVMRDSSINQSKEVLLMALAQKDKEMVRQSYLRLYNYYKDKKAFAVALGYIEKLRRIDDTIRSESAIQEIARAEIRYKSQKKEAENQRLLLENKLTNTQLAQAEKERKTAILGATFLVLAFGLIGYLVTRTMRVQQNAKAEQRLNKTMYDTEQKERIRIARDLHDSIGQHLWVIKMQLNAQSIKLADSEQAPIKASIVLVDSTIAEVRNISHNLLPEALSFGLYAAFDDLCDKVMSSGGPNIQFSFEAALREKKFSQQFQLSIYRIVQEVLTNMVRHAQAKNITFSVAEGIDAILIDIQDDGDGFDTSKIVDSDGIGWQNTFARVNMLNGKMNVSSERIRGTKIEISLPQSA